MKFTEMANLPQNPVKHLIIGQKYLELLEKPLAGLGVSALALPDNGCVDDRLCGHADLSVVHLGHKKVFAASYLKNSGFAAAVNALGADLIFSDIIQGSAYPYDAGLNVCLMGDTLIYNPITAEEEIVTILTNLHDRLIPVRQGYTRCSVCIADENSIITSDEGIASRASSHGMDVLLTKPGLAGLNGFDSGFIGGASFKLSRNKIAFTGLIDDASEKNRIEKFLLDRNIEPVYLTKNILMDIGGAIPLTEWD
jgi:hypothetical protein